MPKDGSLARQPRAVLDHPHGVLAEAYRRVRTNLQFLDASKPLTSFVVTSSLPGEGKSTTSLNLALVMAERGVRVLLVDADLRSPSLGAMCDLEGRAGLSTVLIREADLEDVAQPWQVSGLDVITAGEVPPNPSQLLESPAMDQFLRRAREQYDLVIVDTAPLLAVTDAAVLARKTDGALVVARSRKVRRPELADALATLDSVGATVLGILVNLVPTSRGELRYGYGYHAAQHKGGVFRRLRSPRRAGGRMVADWAPLDASADGPPADAMPWERELTDETVSSRTRAAHVRPTRTDGSPEGAPAEGLPEAEDTGAGTAEALDDRVDPAGPAPAGESPAAPQPRPATQDPQVDADDDPPSRQATDDQADRRDDEAADAGGVDDETEPASSRTPEPPGKARWTTGDRLAAARGNRGER